MKVNVSHKLYLHTIYESYNDVEWLKITTENVLFRDLKCVTHIIPIKRIVEFNVSQ